MNFLRRKHKKQEILPVTEAVKKLIREEPYLVPILEIKPKINEPGGELSYLHMFGWDFYILKIPSLKRQYLYYFTDDRGFQRIPVKYNVW